MIDLKLKPYYLKWIENDESIRKMAYRCYMKSGSEDTVRMYIDGVIMLSKFMKMKPSEILESKFDWEAILNEFIAWLMFERKIARSTILIYFNGVRKWLETNLDKETWREIDWRRIDKPQKWKVERDRIPLKEDLQLMVRAANLREKAIITLAVSSGLRQSTILKLKIRNVKVYDQGQIKSLLTLIYELLMNEVINIIKNYGKLTINEIHKKTDIPKETLMEILSEMEKRNIIKIENENYILNDIQVNFELSNKEIGIIIVEPEQAKERPEKYMTFCTPEALKYISLYLIDRVKRGEKLSLEKFLFVNRSGRPLMKNTFRENWRKLLSRIGKNIKHRKWNQYRFHTLRKYFKTWCILSGVDRLISEFWMGHKAGIEGVYFLQGIEDLENPALIERLIEEYKKALPQLTIFTGVEDIRSIERKWEDRFEELREELKERDQKIIELEKRIEQLI
ncbi:MAG: hypothetical protein DRJ21_00230, partial [Candidatus Methanomethylicota archaeon]